MGENKSGVLYLNGVPLFNVDKMPLITFNSDVSGGKANGITIGKEFLMVKLMF